MRHEIPHGLIATHGVIDLHGNHGKPIFKAAVGIDGTVLVKECDPAVKFSWRQILLCFLDRLPAHSVEHELVPNYFVGFELFFYEARD